MTDVLVAVMLTLAVAVGWIGVIRLTRSVRHTSLTAAAAWAIWFQVTLTATTIATLAKSRVPLGILDQLWYLTAVSGLCPFVAVLGARRSRLLEWSCFIVLPLIVVLEWPALAQLSRCWRGQRLELEMPTLVGYAIVLLMGAGNFVGTRFTWPAIFFAGGWGLILLSNSSFETVWLRRAPDAAVGPIQLWFWWWAFHFAKQKNAAAGWQKICLDFRDHFGVVWSTRLTARINEVAQREKWPWTLTANGLVPTSNDAPSGESSATDPRVDHAFRWLLKPFVDPEWIDERLTASTDRASDG